MTDTKRQAVRGFTSKKQLKATIAKLYKMGAKPLSGQSEDEFFKQIMADPEAKNVKTVGLTLQEDLTYTTDFYDYITPQKLTLKTPIREMRFKKIRIETSEETMKDYQEILERIMKRKKSFKQKFIRFSKMFVIALVVFTIWTALINVAYQNATEGILAIVASFIIAIILYIGNSDFE